MWTIDYENLLESVRLNSVHMSRTHKRLYFRYKNMSNMFRVPTIVLSAVASVSSVGLQSYMTQQNISGMTCLISLIIGVMNSVELYLKLQEAIELELEKSKKWYQLASNIYKVLALDRTHREQNPENVLNRFYDAYMILFEESSLSGVNYSDRLLVTKKLKLNEMVVSSNASSSSSINSNDGDVSPLVRRDQILEEQL
jgi:hypothetical protein